MARVTVEDCILKIPNRYELTLINAERAKNLIDGSTSVVSARPEGKGRKWDDKPIVVALREIAESDNLDYEELTNKMIGKEIVAKPEDDAKQNEVESEDDGQDIPSDTELDSIDQSTFDASEVSENNGYSQAESLSDLHTDE